jgi:hypothetical protein
MTRPLDHITVVSLEHAIAAPLCTRHLADLGARVIKVERPGAGDDTRAGGPPFRKDAEGKPTKEAGYYLAVNRGKRWTDEDRAAYLEVGGAPSRVCCVGAGLLAGWGAARAAAGRARAPSTKPPRPVGTARRCWPGAGGTWGRCRRRCPSPPSPSSRRPRAAQATRPSAPSSWRRPSARVGC